MKNLVLLSTMGLLAAGGATIANAQELGRVLSATPVIQQVAVPRQVCTTQPMAVQQPGGTTGTGAVIGGLAGGVIGNQIGHGGGRAAATALGVIGGALLGNNVEGNQAQAAQVQNVQQCTTQTSYENRTSGYNVRYEYAGKEYQVQLPYDPGPTIRLQVTPISSFESAPDVAAAVPVQPAVVATAQPVMVAPAYPAYVPAPYYGYPPVGLSFSLGYIGGGGGHRHHWR
ncbi:glycine zipper 2TM domain-containing protein [Ramlibacter sp.]|uniref:glycine zipper 2TM domain-containing protein n=1 Tax=Ramlibacter sp. TaxID=1917967 RepID=UPI002C9A2503|nr:glycine zipper 2TM domain-containing protein [Ramlibacter sp.]HWI82267.1 glycine zipper 2TM domain-containing protein [Ramlibacter sp.]